MPRFTLKHGKSNRTHLASLYAQAHGKSRQVDELRTVLNKECGATQADLAGKSPKAESDHEIRGKPAGCVSLAPTGHPRQSVLVDMYSNSEFCLSPHGDQPMRAGVFDSLAALCIPVFFASCANRDLIYEIGHFPILPALHRTTFGVGTWAVLLNSTKVEQRSGSLVASLSAINVSTRACLRANIARIWSRLLYREFNSTFNGPSVPDIYSHLVLSFLSRESERESNGWKVPPAALAPPRLRRCA